MTKAEIVNEVAKATGIEKDLFLIVVVYFMVIVLVSLSNGYSFYLRQFHHQAQS